MDVVIKGFQDTEQMKNFLSWYSNSGEQAFYEWNQEQKGFEDSPTNIDVHRKGNYNCYDLSKTQIVAYVK